MKFSTIWFVGTTTILLLDSSSSVYAAKIKNKCNAIGDGKGKIDKSDCEDNEKYEIKKNKCKNAKPAKYPCKGMSKSQCKKDEAKKECKFNKKKEMQK